MPKSRRSSGLALMVSLLAAPAAWSQAAGAGKEAVAADAVHGQMLFQQDCAMCHTAGPADGGGGAGPDLAGVIGRRVAGDANFAYSEALLRLGGVWTKDSLVAFLDDPGKVAPGTTMSVSAQDPAEWADIAAYLATTQPRKP
jgi:cytochrome c